MEVGRHPRAAHPPQGQTFLWTRGEELVTDRYPELAEVGAVLPDGTVARRRDPPLEGRRAPALRPAPAADRPQVRRARRSSPRCPSSLVAYDLLEDARRATSAPARSSGGGRGSPSSSRRRAASGRLIRLAARRRPTAGTTWPRPAPSSRERQVEGLMLKRLGSAYRVGRQRGDWWKWKVNPLTIDAVLIAAQRGQRQAGQPVHRLHLRRLGRGPARPDRQGVLGPDRRGDPPGRRLRPPQHRREVRPGPHRQARARLRARLRGHPALDAAQVGHRRPLPPHPPLARRQAAAEADTLDSIKGMLPPEESAGRMTAKAPSSNNLDDCGAGVSLAHHRRGTGEGPAPHRADFPIVLDYGLGPVDTLRRNLKELVVDRHRDRGRVDR